MYSSVISLRTVSGGIYSLLLPARSMSNPSNISSCGEVWYRGKLLCIIAGGAVSSSVSDGGGVRGVCVCGGGGRVQ